jgi:RNA polymerase sigma-70 factor (ECF subfamily)
MSHETCRNLLSQLSDYIDGELEESLCAEIEQHMAGCPDCRAVVNTLEKTVELYRTTGRAEVPADVQTRLYKILKLDQIGRST